LNSFEVLSFMRFILGFLSGALGLLAGWFGLAALVIGRAGPDRDGGAVGFVGGVLLFIKPGLISQATPSSDAERPPQLAASFIHSWRARDVTSWHFSDMPSRPDDFRSSGQKQDIPPTG
jgi:hypothetical protein